MAKLPNPSPSKRRELIKAGKWDPNDPIAKLVRPPPPSPASLPPPKKCCCNCQTGRVSN